MYVCRLNSYPIDPSHPPSFSTIYQLYCEFSAKSEKFTVDTLDPAHRLTDIDTRYGNHRVVNVHANIPTYRRFVQFGLMNDILRYCEKYPLRTSAAEIVHGPDLLDDL